MMTLPFLICVYIHSTDSLEIYLNSCAVKLYICVYISMYDHHGEAGSFSETLKPKSAQFSGGEDVRVASAIAKPIAAPPRL